MLRYRPSLLTLAFRFALPFGVLFAAAAAVSSAQPAGPGGPPQGGAIAGRVVDAATGAPIGFATVALYQAPDTAFVTGTVTGDDGAFLIERLRPGTYEVRVSFVGYASRSIGDVAVRPGPPVALGDVRLEEAAAQLDETEVTAQRELVEQQADRTVYNVANQPVSTGGSALETLQTLPSIEVDTDGNLALRGNQNVAVHINGRPVPVRGAFLAGMLRQIPATNVERIEVIPNPSARHEADEMGGIINIVLKQGTSRGLSGGFTLGGGSAPAGEASGNVSYQQGRFDGTASYGLRYDDFDMVAFSDRTVFDSTGTSGTRSLQDFSATNGFLSHLFNGTLDYTLRPGLFATLNGSLSARFGDTDNFSTVDVAPTGGSATGREVQITDGGHDGTNADVSLGLRREFAPQTHTLSAEARFTRNWDEDDDAFTFRSLDLDDPASSDSSFSRNLVAYTTHEGYFQTDYVRPLGRGRFEAGGKGTVRRQDNDLLFEDLIDGEYTTNPDRTNRFVLDEHVYAGYLQAAHPVGPVEVQLGLRAEAFSRDYALTAAEQEDTGAIALRLDLFPSAFVSYTYGEGSLVKASYSRRINRPRHFMLNPFTTFEDQFNIRRGNPDLLPEFTDAFELTLQYRYFLTLTPFYRRTTDPIRQRLTVGEDGVSVFSFQNFDEDESYGADLTLALALPGNRLRGFLSGSAFRSVTDGGSIESGLAADALGWNVRGNVQANLRRGTDLQLFAFYRAPLDVPDGRISGFGVATLGLSQKLLNDRATVSLRVNDVLSTSRFQWRTEDETRNYTFFGERNPDLQQVNLTFTYTFGQQPRRRPPPRPQEQPQQDGGFGF
ncbi:MAG TPA: TonB-dependent receptor [Rubricoccaceae bacterium]|nr:TonB-dependent receptor [Rubricoccaceae bacterium]